MSEWAPKRFWDEARASEVEGGFTVQLDGRPVRTPAKSALILPTNALADAIAAEWDAQVEKVDPTTMPCTRSANAAIDKVTPQHAEVVDMLAGYGATDLLCYRAEGPAALVARQAEAWDPLLDWARDSLNAPLQVTSGVLPTAQPKQSLDQLHRLVARNDPFSLVALHDLVSLSGSLIIGLATAAGKDDAEALWRASRIDESWQEEQWGEDSEATALAESKRNDFLHAVRFHGLVSQ